MFVSKKSWEQFLQPTTSILKRTILGMNLDKHLSKFIAKSTLFLDEGSTQQHPTTKHMAQVGDPKQ